MVANPKHQNAKHAGVISRRASLSEPVSPGRVGREAKNRRSSIGLWVQRGRSKAGGGIGLVAMPDRFFGSRRLHSLQIGSSEVNFTGNFPDRLKLPKSDAYSFDRLFTSPTALRIMITKSVRFALVLSLPLLSGCGMCRSVEQWKCDNWGMCHFAPTRPGVYSPTSVQPSYGAPMGYGAPTGTAVGPTVGSVPPAAPMLMPTANPAGMSTGGPGNPNCKDCNR
jgi:hypothetical protein